MSFELVAVAFEIWPLGLRLWIWKVTDRFPFRKPVLPRLGVWLACASYIEMKWSGEQRQRGGMQSGPGRRTALAKARGQRYRQALGEERLR